MIHFAITTLIRFLLLTVNCWEHWWANEGAVKRAPESRASVWIQHFPRTRTVDVNAHYNRWVRFDSLSHFAEQIPLDFTIQALFKLRFKKFNTAYTKTHDQRDFKWNDFALWKEWGNTHRPGCTRDKYKKQSLKHMQGTLEFSFL